MEKRPVETTPKVEALAREQHTSPKSPNEPNETDGLAKDLSELQVSAGSTTPPTRLILCDAAYGLPKEARPRRERMLAICRQLVNFLAWQKEAKDGVHRPADIQIVGCPDQATQKALTDRMHEIWKKTQPDTSFPENLTFTEKPLEAFCFENPDPPVYLSPDAEESLDPAQAPPNVVVVGLLIDRRIQLNRSKDRAKQLTMPVARWPLDAVPHIDPNEPLNVDTILEGQQQWYWNCQDVKQPSDACFQRAALQALQHHETRHPARTRHTVAKKTTVVFLDIDGVLLPFQGKRFSSTCGSIFPDHTLEAFSLILDTIKGSRIVLSSTWRVQDKFRKDIVQGLRSYGYEYGGALLEADFMDLTDPEMHSERQHEIHDWLLRNGEKTGAWIALDDEELLEGPENVANRAEFEGHAVKTDSHIGLTVKDARHAIELLQRQLNSGS